MKAHVEVDGTIRTVDVSVDKITLRESVEIQRLIGNDEWDAFAEGTARPVAIQATIYVKLRKEFPGLSVDDFDVAISSMEGEAENPTTGS